MTATPSWSQRVWADLQPGPGRLPATLRIVLATVVSLILMMVLQMPFAALGLYFVFLVGRDSPFVSVISGLYAMGALVFAVAAELAVVIVTDNDPTARLISVGVVALIAGLLMAASTLPPLGSIWGLVYCTLIPLWERPAPADALVKSSLYLVGTISIAFGVSVAVEYLFAFRSAADRLTDQIILRYKTVAGVYSLFAQGASPAQLGAPLVGLNRLAGAGQRPMQALHNAALESGAETVAGRPLSRVRLTLLAEMMDAAAAYASAHPAGVPAEERQRCAEIARHCTERSVPSAGAPSPEPTSSVGASLLDRIEAKLYAALADPADAEAEASAQVVELPAAKTPFLVPGAITNRNSIEFALKVALCAFVCYVFYFAVAWPGISTSVTTVFITALGNSGAIKQKLLNRLVGSALGGALALFAAAFLFPNMDSIFSLTLLIAAVAFISAWSACGRQFGYAGLQIAFSFYLIAFEGFSAPTQLAPARDRLIGILVALFVIWLVFDQLWPIRTVTAMRAALATILKNQARVLRLFETDLPQSARLQQVEVLRDLSAKTIAGLRTLNDTIPYEFGVDRRQHERSGAAILKTALSVVPFFWQQLAAMGHDPALGFATDERLKAMRRVLAERLDVLAAAALKKSVPADLADADLADPALLDDPRYAEYVAATLHSHREFRTQIEALAAEV